MRASLGLHARATLGREAVTTERAARPLHQRGSAAAARTTTAVPLREPARVTLRGDGGRAMVTSDPSTVLHASTSGCFYMIATTISLTRPMRTSVGLVSSLCALGIACSSSKDEQQPPPANQPPVIAEPGGGVAGGGSGLAGDGDLDQGFDGEDACVGQSAGTEASPAVLQLVVDTSGSMDQDAPGRGQGSKWQATRAALLDAVEQMPESTSLGLVFYPDVDGDDDDDDDACFDREIDVTIGRLDTAHRRRVTRALQSQSPEGGTPTHDAYRFAIGALEESDAPGARFAVVITDGTPTYSLGCVGTGLVTDPVDPGPLVPEAAAAAARGIRTFVIGSPGSEGARESLSEMAEAGGTARPGCSHDGPNYCHFDMTEEPDFAAALAEALGQITGLALTCSYDVPAPPGGAALDPTKVNVVFQPRDGESEVIPQSTGSSCREGWQYSADQSQVLLCGTTCDRVRETNGTLTLQFGCTTRVR